MTFESVPSFEEDSPQPTSKLSQNKVVLPGHGYSERLFILPCMHEIWDEAQQRFVELPPADA